MSEPALRYTDVSLTDGQSARWAGAMTTPMMLAVATRLAAARPAAIEIASPATLQQCMARGENPWQRIELLRERCPGIVLRAAVALLTEHGKRGADVISTEVATLWLRELAQRGVSEIVLIDPMVAIERIAPVLKEAKALGLTTITTLPVTQESTRSDDDLRSQAAALARTGATRLMLRDEAGLLTADRLTTLLPALRAGLGATPLDLHLRCQTALGPMVALEAVRIGIDGLDTAFAPLANGASVPALGTLLKSLRMLSIETSISAQDLHAVGEADRSLADLADRHGFGANQAWVFDLAPYAHQLPGEVAAQFMQRLATLRLAHKLHAFANECARVRSNIGAPPMLAPFARPIAEQALLHLQGTPRYAEIRPGVRRALQQAYGTTSGAVDARLAQRVGALPKKLAPSVASLRAADPQASDAALVLGQICGVAPEAVPTPASPETMRYVATTPADALLAGLTARAARYALLCVQGPGVAIQLQATEA
jgi:oxaloacetate decarboxylase (Na+ extruding) subunit alpha